MNHAREEKCDGNGLQGSLNVDYILLAAGVGTPMVILGSYLRMAYTNDFKKHTEQILPNCIAEKNLWAI
jgi:hypothetical protein